MSNVPKQLKDAGINEIKFYYKNAPLVGNIYTTCVLLSEDNKMLARGVAICSVLDSHDKKAARKLSRDRALAAYFHRNNSLEISKDDPLFQAAMLFSKDMVRKTFKFKTEEIKNTLLQDAVNLGFESHIEQNKLVLYIPYYYSIIESKKYFTWKSEFNPTPTEEEKRIFKI